MSWLRKQHFLSAGEKPHYIGLFVWVILDIHPDEATPHPHIDYIPIGHYKRGVDTQNGLAQALKEMGFGDGENAINHWRLSERAVLEGICQNRGIEIKPPAPGRGHSFTVDEYKERQEKLKNLAEKEKIGNPRM